MNSQFLHPEEVQELVGRLTQQSNGSTQSTVQDVAEATGLSDVQVAQELERMRLEKRIAQLEDQLRQSQSQNNVPPQFSRRHWNSGSIFRDFNGPIRLLIIFAGIALLSIADGISHLLSHL